MARMLPYRLSVRLEHLLGRTIPDTHLPDAPHFDALEYAFWRANVETSLLYLEYGSGGSTIEAARLGCTTITVENDIHYAKAVRRKAALQSSSEIISVNLGPVLKWGKPYLKTKSARRLRLWKKYSTAPWKTIGRLGRFPDFVLIDGRFRRACLLETLVQANKSAASTVVMFDDYFMAGRSHYHVVEEYIGAPERIGRAAIWRIDDGVLRKVPTAANIAEANADFE